MQNSSVYGHLPEFSPEKGNFEVYVERFEAFAAANKIDKATKQQVFLPLIGEAAYTSCFRICCSPKTPAEASYDDVGMILLKHFAPKRSMVVERYKFYRRDQRQRESIIDFVVKIKKLAAMCDFGTFSEEALRDPIIVGLKNNAIRCKLLIRRKMAKTSGSTGLYTQSWEWKLPKDKARMCCAQMKRQPVRVSRETSTDSESPHRGKLERILLLRKS
ncbi:hypothetical protein HPB47_003349 [Ixodes persulcatus]|uniref:Uncharacterized protein n=1 Tax=Ixodes persulcatus TaxID=34615 RepID=A0AC60PIN6_IXOPE|nr:hypothetical protein HPB47_003349 [Ixodes persulcatus]